MEPTTPPRAPFVPARVRAVCARAAALCERLAAADLPGLPVYVVPDTAAAAVLGRPAAWEGFTAPTLDELLRPAIGDAWRGRGPCMVVNDRALLAYEVFAGDFEASFLPVAVHELAHVIEAGYAFPDCPERTPGHMAAVRNRLAAIVSVAEVPADELPKHRADHGPRYIRAAVHLAHRAGRLGEPVPLGQVCSHAAYGFHHVRWYAEALGTEPADLEDWPLRALLATRPPAAFAELAAQDFPPEPEPASR